MELFVSFSEFMHFFKRNRVKFLLVVLIFGVVCGLLPLKFLHFSYSANTTVTFSCEMPETARTDYRQQYASILSVRVSTAVAQAESHDLIEKTADKLGIDKSEISKISADQQKGAPVIKLTVQTIDGNKAAEISDTAAQILSDEIVRQFPSPKLTASITDKALPLKPGSKKLSMVKAGILGLILGFIVYICYGMIRVLTDHSVRNGRFTEESLKIKLLGEIPHEKRGQRRPDAFRKMRAVTLHQTGGSEKCFTVTSTSRNDGGAETAVGFASSLAQAGKKVLLVDADLHEPKLASAFGVLPAKTLNESLEGICTAEEAAVKVPSHHGLSLVSGKAVKGEENPADLIARGFQKFEADAEACYDAIVVYVPSQEDYPDAESLAACSPAIIFAVRYGVTSYRSLQDALRNLSEAGGRTAGFVLTDA